MIREGDAGLVDGAGVSPGVRSVVPVLFVDGAERLVGDADRC